MLDGFVVGMVGREEGQDELLDGHHRVVSGIVNPGRRGKAYRHVR